MCMADICPKTIILLSSLASAKRSFCLSPRMHLNSNSVSMQHIDHTLSAIIVLPRRSRSWMVDLRPQNRQNHQFSFWSFTLNFTAINCHLCRLLPGSVASSRTFSIPDARSRRGACTTDAYFQANDWHAIPGLQVARKMRACLSKRSKHTWHGKFLIRWVSFFLLELREK